MAMASEQVSIGIRRFFTSPDAHPYDALQWERRDARIQNWKDGTDAFFQPEVEFPSTWSLNASNIVAQKYFRGTLGTPEREWSLRQVIDRVADTITDWGVRDGYFIDADEADAFRNELKSILVTQRAAFNSPVWFNIGVKGVPQQASACFILSVDDTMDGILNWYREEGIIFKGGSGAGTNLSNIRSSAETLKGGGTASGPVSFMRGADASAGTIKSGGKTRRAAKMVILNADHPDIEEFIWCKAIEERKARVLRDAGFDMDLDGKDSFSVQYQNANNSVRITDEFMQAVLEDKEWDLKAVTTGETVRTVPARELMRQISEASWQCADPGLQFDTTINRWHTAPNSGRINGSNPCFPGDARVHTDKGLVRFDDLMARLQRGETFDVYTHDATNPDAPAEVLELTTPEAVMITGWNELVRLRFENGMELRCTPNHRVWTTNRGWVRADELAETDDIKTADLPNPADLADWRLPIEARLAGLAARSKQSKRVELPEKWTEEFAHYLGYLVGDGCVASNGTLATVYGGEEERNLVLPRHQALLEAMTGAALKPADHKHGTQSLRVRRSMITRFFEFLGMERVRAHDKHVPEAVFGAPDEAAAGFLRGLFDADGCVFDGDKSRYVGLATSSSKLVADVAALLSRFGIRGRVYTQHRAGTKGFAYTRKDGTEVEYESRDCYDLRITGPDLVAFAERIGFTLPRKADKLAAIFAESEFYNRPRTTRLVERADDGSALTYNLTEPRNHSYLVNGVVVSNCSEYVHLDNSACNLSSINLLKFLGDDGAFDVSAFTHTVDVMFTAQEILVGNSDYPTEKIGDNARKFRQLGLGYANLGALLMAQGLPYDSNEGRAWAGAITALMTGHAYATSAKTAGRMGPFAGFDDNRAPMLNVLSMHRAAAATIDEEVVPTELLSAAQRAWDDAVELGELHGVRNSQATVLAPTGTIGLMMDCDTTGIEPDLALMKAKKLVGGGTMYIVNQTIPRALARLGYSPEQVDAIVAYINEEKTILGAPGFKKEHEPVFACSMGDNTIHYLGHVTMMSAVQPFLSGAISKTVNMPEEASVEDVEALHIEAWRLGLKAVAIYRDNCKVGQPLSTQKKQGSEAATDATPLTDSIERIVETIIVQEPVRQKLPRARNSKTFSFRVADCHGYVTVGEFEDGRPGELFLKVAKQGSTLAGIMDAFAISVSHGLQYGVPLSAFVDMFTNMRFEPSGMTDDPEIRFAASLVDYIFRRLAIEYLPFEERREMGILTVDERIQPTLPGVEEAVPPREPGMLPLADQAPSASIKPTPVVNEAAPTREREMVLCYVCGDVMQRAGSCFACPSCGSTSGCS